MKIRPEKKGGGAQKTRAVHQQQKKKAHEQRMLITKPSSKLAAQHMTAKHFATDASCKQESQHTVEY